MSHRPAGQTRRVAVLHPRDGRPADAAFGERLGRLNEATVGAIRSLGWEAEVVASGELPAAASLAAARAADMIVLMGGEDVDPALYGGSADYPGAGAYETAADIAQVAVVRDAVLRGAPLLGICRGHQLLDVALGGTLVSHLASDHAHRRVGDANDPFVSTLVTVDADLARDVADPTDVRCSHHQAIDVVAPDLRVVARAADGIVEAVVHRSAPVTGVQWHPEHPDVATTQLVALLRRMERQRGEGRSEAEDAASAQHERP